MGKQINISFKNTIPEQELYNWLKNKLNTGSYVKEVLNTEFLREQEYIKNIRQSEKREIPEAKSIEETKIMDSAWEME